MTKLLEKALKEAVKVKKCAVGTKQVMSSIKNSKLIVISQSVSHERVKKVEKNAQNEKIPVIYFEGTSVALGRLCGLQFRVSTISLDSLTTSNTQAILKENEQK
tara:strand:+ start:2075 stop:2386 length:312 start_codon:yes stop_codon:yes gene_type:complete